MKESPFHRWLSEYYSNSVDTEQQADSVLSTFANPLRKYAPTSAPSPPMPPSSSTNNNGVIMDSHIVSIQDLNSSTISTTTSTKSTTAETVTANNREVDVYFTTGTYITSNSLLLFKIIYNIKYIKHHTYIY